MRSAERDTYGRSLPNLRLDLEPATVKTRLHRARALLRRKLLAQMEPVERNALPFEAPRCDRVVAAVLAKIT